MIIYDLQGTARLLIYHRNIRINIDRSRHKTLKILIMKRIQIFWYSVWSTAYPSRNDERGRILQQEQENRFSMRRSERDRTLALFLNADETDAISCAQGANRLDTRVVAVSQLRHRSKKKMLDLVRGFYTALRFVTRMIRSAEFSDVRAV